MCFTSCGSLFSGRGSPLDPVGRQRVVKAAKKKERNRDKSLDKHDSSTVM